MGLPAEEAAAETPLPASSPLRSSPLMDPAGSYEMTDAEDVAERNMDGDVAMGQLLQVVQEGLAEDVKKLDKEILRVVRDLGGNVQTYKHERRRDLARVVSEVYSQPRVTAAAKLLPRLRLIPGLALDLTTEDENGEPWNFDYAERREAARRLLREQKPAMLIGSPSCREFCTWKALHNSRRGPEETARARASADVFERDPELKVHVQTRFDLLTCCVYS